MVCLARISALLAQDLSKSYQRLLYQRFSSRPRCTADNKWNPVTKYDIYSDRIKCDIADLNCAHRPAPEEEAALKGWRNRSLGSLGDTRGRFVSCPLLEYVHNEKSCLAPDGAKGVRYEVHTGRRSSLPRIGSFEVVLAVYRSHEDQWKEFVLFSKLGRCMAGCGCVVLC